MAHEYSVMIHKFIGDKIIVAEQGKQAAIMQGDLNTQRFHEGQLSELLEIRRQLTERVDLKTQRYF